VSAEEQIEKLANFITAEVDGKPSESEGAGDCAIRIIRELKERTESAEHNFAVQLDATREAEAATSPTGKDHLIVTFSTEEVEWVAMQLHVTKEKARQEMLLTIADKARRCQCCWSVQRSIGKGHRTNLVLATRENTYSHWEKQQGFLDGAICPITAYVVHLPSNIDKEATMDQKSVSNGLRDVDYGDTIDITTATGAALRNAKLRNAVLPNANLQRADLRGADLRNANLNKADLRGADLRGADLRDADLRGADLHGADLRNADLYGADLRGALGLF